jgi:4-hydroxybenzoate polyprenyltransferase
VGAEIATAARAGVLGELVRAARPLQWTKNLLLFAGILFAVEVDDPARWADALLIFAAYCAASSAAYLVNDVRDRERDAAHPVKRRRPVAAGTLSPGTALAAAAVLVLVAAGLGLLVGIESLGLLAGFVALQLAYTARLKDVILVDILVISGLFVVRAAAGAVAVDVRLSPWLVVCTGLLALFLALAKRRGELLQLHADETPSRPVLAGYSLELVDQLLSVVAAATISAYALYTFTATSSEAMMLTIPFVVFGIFRYLYLVHRRDLGEEPEQVLIRDPAILLTVAGWVATAALILLLAE